MLDGPRYPNGDIKFRCYDFTGLTDLPIVRRITGVDGGTRCADRSPELVGHRLQILGEILARCHCASAGHDNARRGEFRPVGLGDFFADEGRYPRILGRHPLPESATAVLPSTL